VNATDNLADFRVSWSYRRRQGSMSVDRVGVLVRGIGDIGSAVTHRLFGAGHRVVIHDVPAPAAPRRGMAFTDAIFDGTVVLASMVVNRRRHLSVSAAAPERCRLD